MFPAERYIFMLTYLQYCLRTDFALQLPPGLNNNVYTRRPYGVAMCRAWCGRSGECETFWFSPTTLECVLTKTHTNLSNHNELQIQKENLIMKTQAALVWNMGTTRPYMKTEGLVTCEGKTCHTHVECITSRSSGNKCVREKDIILPKIYLGERSGGNTTLFEWGQNADRAPLEKHIFQKQIKEIRYFSHANCLLVLESDNADIGCIDVEHWHHKTLYEDRDRTINRRWVSMAVSVLRGPLIHVFLLGYVASPRGNRSDVTKFHITREGNWEKKPFKRTQNTIGDTITVDSGSKLLYVPGLCEGDLGKTCIYKKSFGGLDLGHLQIRVSQIRSLMFDNIDSTLKFVSKRKMGVCNPSRRICIMHEEMPSVTYYMLCTPQYLIFLGKKGVVVNDRQHSTLTTYHARVYDMMTLGG